MKIFVSAVLALVAPASALAGSYFQQSTIPVSAGAVHSLDRDALGNVYVLGLPPGGTAYRVSGYQTPSMTPLFSFETGVSSPVAFAVEGSGIIDILDASTSAVTMKRFQNTGAFLGQVTYSLTPSIYETHVLLSAAIDKVNGLVYLAYSKWQSYYCLQCLGCGCPPSGTKGFIEQWDFNGVMQRVVSMPGISATAGSCYTPSSLTTDPQGSLYVADNSCQHLLKYSKGGTLLNDFPAGPWSSGYYFTARGMWSDQDANLYISQPVCGATGCQQGVVKLDGTANVLGKVTADSPRGCAWDDRVLYLSSSGLAPVRRFVDNGVPGVPSEIAPIGPVVQHSSSAALAWQYANDPDGDAVQYFVSLGTSPTQLTPIGSSEQQMFTTQPLSFETTYYWQVVAEDSYEGIPLQRQSAPVVSFRMSLRNSAPGGFSVLSGTGTQVTRDSLVRLSWGQASDADGDPIVYEVSWRAGAAAPVLTTTPATSLMINGLSFGTTYYWSVRARDVYGVSTPMNGPAEQSYMAIFQNSAPSVPAYLTAPTVYSLHTASPTVALGWVPSQDLDGDDVTYRLELVGGGEGWSVELGTSTALTLATVFETTYSWRVTAIDTYGAASIGAWRTFIVHLANQAPAPIVLSSAETLSTRTTSYALSWQDTGDPDGDAYSYSLFLSTNPGTLMPVQSGLRTSYSLGFAFGTTYYWQVAATDSFGARTTGPIQSFLATFRNTAPGMPTVVSGSGASFQHTLTPAATLAWSAVNDADGDLTAYRLWLGNSAQSMSLVQDGSQTSFSLPSPQLGTTYYWQVSAYDPYGGVATTPGQTLFIQLQNGAPLSPGALTGTGILSTRNTSQVLSWSTAHDPDGDSVSYDFALSTDPAVLPVVRVSTATSYSLSFQYGTTYYWQATARDGLGGVSSTGLQTLLPVFRNSAPTVPANLSKTGTLSYHGWSPSQSLFWQDSADPDGDAFVYSVFFGTDSERLSPVASASLGQTFPNLAVNTAYYYRIVATDIYGAASASPLNWVYYQFSNGAPQAFDPIGPSGAVVTRNANQSLSWTSSSDPDADLVTYRIYVGTSASSLAPLADTTQTSAQWPGLAFGSTYYWRVAAYDAFGATTTASGGIQSFGLNFRNAPPSAPGYPAALAVHEFHTQTPSVALNWSPSSDADGDAVSYRLDLGLSTTTFQAYALGTATTFSHEPAFGTTYYWRITAADPYGGSTSGPWSSFVARFVNRAPSAPSVLGGSGVSRQHTLTPNATLAWSAATDPDGDPTLFRLAVGSTPQSLSIVQDGSLTSYALPSPQLGTTYYWQVSAYDPYGGLTATSVQSLLIELQNAAPVAPAPLTGTGILSTRNTSQLLSWSAAADPDDDPVTYEFSLSTNAASLPIVQASSATSFLLSFQYGTTYYWRATARDGFGGVSATAVQTFLPVFKNSAPTVPSNLSKTGTLSYHGWSPSQSLFWQDSADPDGDPFVYSVFFGTDSERLSPVASASLGQTFPNLAVNTAYYYRIVATDIFGAASASPLNWVYYQFSNGAPQAFDPIGPSGAVVTRNANQSLSWTSSSDPDADLVTYRVYVGTSASSLASLTDTTQTSAQWPGLLFGATYYWRVAAYDAFGATTTASGGVQTFGLNFRNAPPTAPGYATTLAVHEFHTQSPEVALNWSPSSDPDGDAVSYRLDLGLSTTTFQAYALGAATTFSHEPAFGTTYYWRITAADPYGGATSGSWSSFVARFVNRAPSAPTVLGGSGISRQHTLAPSATLAWSASTDPDGDPTLFRLSVGSTPQLLSIVQDGSSASYALPSPQLGTTYYWQVSAYDPYGGLTATSVQSLLIELQNTAPVAPAPLTGTGILSTRNTSQLLSWSAAADPDDDPVTYEFSLSTNAASLPIVQASSATSFLLSFQYGTTYYWQVSARDGFGGVSATAVQTFLPVFKNSAPTVPSNLSKTGTLPYHGWSPSQSIFWQDAADPDGDAFTYSVNFGTDSDRPSFIGSVPLGFTLPNLAVNTAYYYRIVATDIHGAASASPLNWVYYQFFNNPPRVFDPVGPSGAVVTRNANQSLSWTASSDPDGDLVTYRVLVGTAPGALTPLTDTTQTAASWSGLPFGATYYWRVDAYDAFGATTAATGGTQSFGLAFRNSAPTMPGYSGTAAMPEFHTLFPNLDLTWSASSDADGDSISYRLDLGLSTGSAQAFSLGAATTFTLHPLFETTYYWRVTAIDPYGGTTAGPWASVLARFVNRAPAAPTVLAGAGISRQHTLTPSASLSWSSASDPDGDGVAYRLALGSSPQSLSVVQDGPLTSYALPAAQLGTTYYWQVSAYDQYGGLGSSAVQSLLLELQNAAPAAPAPLTGTGPLSTRSTAQLLSWSAALDPDGDAVTYEFSLSTDPATLPVVRTSTATTFPLSFEFGTTYYWRAAARDSFGAVSTTGVQVFQPAFRNSAPTVPANLSKSGTISYHGWSPSQSLFWQDSTDPDGDAFTYSIHFGTDSERLSPLAPASLGQTFQHLAVNTAYYYRIVATDIHGAASASPLNWVFYQFSNSAPQAFDPVGPSGSVVSRNPNQALSWTPSSDSDADLLTYRVSVGTAASALAPLADTTLTSVQWPGLAFGSTYYWRVEAYDGFGATTTATGGVQSFALLFRNSAPAALTYTSTATVQEFHTLSPQLTLGWAPAADPDGDGVAYRLDLGQSTGSWQSFGLADARTFALTPQFDTTYYWRVTAADPYGASTTGAWSTILARFVNRVPAVPSVLGGAGVSRQHTLTPSAGLSWSTTADPEGDAIVYRLHVGTSASALSLAQEGGQTSYLLSAPQFGTTYYWQVSVVDSYGGTTKTPLQTLWLSLDNTAPAPFSPLTGTGPLATRATSQLLSWEASQDADRDPLTYGLFLSSGPASPTLVQLSTATNYLLAFQHGATYYWRVDAFDGFGGTTTATGGVQVFAPTFLNDPPPPLNVTSPFKGSPVVSTMHNRVSLSWEKVTTPQGDPITYTVYLGDSPDSLKVLTRISQEQLPAGLTVSGLPALARPQSQVEAEGDTVRLTLTELDYYRRYYFRIAAENPYGASTQTPLQTFLLSTTNGFPKAYNYPNPFSSGRGGTRLVFNAPPSGYAKATVSIYSELQDLLFRREYANIPAGISEVGFDGRDRYGRSLFNGSYICHVRFEGPDDKETFYLMVVK